VFGEERVELGDEGVKGRDVEEVGVEGVEETEVLEE
jgi:hypothetical protein